MSDKRLLVRSWMRTFVRYFLCHMRTDFLHGNRGFLTRIVVLGTRHASARHLIKPFHCGTKEETNGCITSRLGKVLRKLGLRARRERIQFSARSLKKEKSPETLALTCTDCVIQVAECRYAFESLAQTHRNKHGLTASSTTAASSIIIIGSLGLPMS
jgi:hypothetical protein